MRKKLSKTTLIVVLSLLIVLPMMAQRQTGSIVGTITDEEGNILPGVGVSAKSPALIIPEMTAVTNDQGIYRFPSLPPGTYSITFAMNGMNTLVREEIIVSIGQTVTIDVTLQFKTLEETVTVVGESPLIDSQKSALTTHLDSEFIKAVPAGRDLGSYLFMTPGMVREEGTSVWLTSSAGVGSNVRENKLNLDGISLQDPTVGTQQFEFNMDIMDEVSVETGGISAEYGLASGSVVNVVSKSGGNEFSGSASFYFRDQSLQSDNTKGTALEDSFSGFDYAYEPSLTFGGPLLKDKFWFFLGFNYIRTSQYVSGFPYDKEENVPTITATPYVFGKLSFQPDQNNRFSLTYNFGREFNDHFFATSFDTERTTITMKNPIHSAGLIWTRFFSGNFFTEFRATYGTWDLHYDPQEGQTGPLYTDLITGLNSGSSGAAHNYAQEKFGAKVDGTLFADNLAGSHEFKAGVEYNYAKVELNYFTDPALTDPQYGFGGIQTIMGMPFLALKYLETNAKDKQQDVQFYAQDTWTLSKRLTLNLGARLSHQWLTVPKQNEDEGPQTIGGITFNRSVTESFTSMTWTTVDPRIGLIFDITGDGRTLLKASYGRYTQALRANLSSRFNPNGIAGAAYLVLPDLTPLFPVAVFSPTIAKTEYGDHKVSAPYTDVFTIGLERDFTQNWSAGIRYFKKLGRKNVWDIDGAQLDMDSLMNDGELVWTNWEQVPFVDPYDGSQRYFWSQTQILPNDMYFLNAPGANRDFDGFELTLTKRYSDGWFVMGSYVWGKLKGLLDTGYMQSDPLSALFFQDPNTHVNALGRLEMDRRHQFKFQGLVQGPWGINLSTFLRYLSGARYTRTVSSAQVGVPVAQGTAEIYAEERGSQGLPGRLTIDFRLEKEFRFNTVSLGIFADLFNLLNSNKSIEDYVYSNNPEIPFGSMLRIENPRILRLGARIQF
jgi:hypothetical protein